MSSLAVHFSSTRQDWETPWPFFMKMNDQYGPFVLDVCATPANTKCEQFFTKEENGLLQPWYGRAWMNPPYGRGINAWVKKATEEVRKNTEQVVCLLPARTDTAWWHDYVERYAFSVRFIRGRITFAGARHAAPFPSVIVIFKKETSANDRCAVERYRHTSEDFYL
ncbi:MAG: adenine methyltransferase [Desulfovibrio sp.]|nr:adenine methyltransferase [Desulfovibrio sp.]